MARQLGKHIGEPGNDVACDHDLMVVAFDRYEIGGWTELQYLERMAQHGLLGMWARERIRVLKRRWAWRLPN